MVEMKAAHTLIFGFLAVSLFFTLIFPAFRNYRLWETVTHSEIRLPKGFEDDVPPDKLLAGLLAPDFDDPSCLSRYRASIYRKSSPYKPSAQLISSLRKYEDRHRLCGPHSEFFNETVKLLEGDKNFTSSPCKYLILTTRDGLGNRMLAIVSAFLYALVTDRVVLIDQVDVLDNLFCEPFGERSWLLPENFPMRDQFRFFKNSMGNILRDNINIKPSGLPSYLSLYLSHNANNYDKLFYCEKQQALIQNVPWLIMETNNYIIPGLFLIPSFGKQFSKLFPRKDTAFHHLGRYLFHPTNEIWGLISRYNDAYLSKAKEKLGIQIRVFKSESGSFQHHMDQILACTRLGNLLPELNTTRGAAIPQPKTRKTKAVLITSLSSMYLENAKKLYWEYPTENGDVIGVYQPSHEDFQKTGDGLHNKKALAEIYLLSQSDALVTSAWSTFGYVAQGLAGLKPWILYKPEEKVFGGLDVGLKYKNENETEHSQPCGVALSMEPCFHAPPVCDCENFGRLDGGAVLPFLKHCEDLSWGLKIVDRD